MNRLFRDHIGQLAAKLRALKEMKPVTAVTLPKKQPREPQPVPQSGVYLFSEGKRHLYVGRSNRIRKRIGNHQRASAGHNMATFAYRIACRKLGIKEPAYTVDDSRKRRCSRPDFKRAFRKAKERIRRMDLRFVSEGNQIRQALLELYVHVALGTTQYNDFGTH